MLKRFPLLLLFALVASMAVAQTLTPEESDLYKLIMAYRKENNLPSIPVSPSLTLVAQTHVADLLENTPDRGECNMHSWSSKGAWTACCYTPDHAQANCMWAKPGELTSYKGNGFEIAHGSSDPKYKGYVITAEGALSGWKSSSGHNAVIMNSGRWADHPWKAIGIGMNGSFAVVWFGEEEDR